MRSITTLAELQLLVPQSIDETVEVRGHGLYNAVGLTPGAFEAVETGAPRLKPVTTANPTSQLLFSVDASDDRPIAIVARLLEGPQGTNAVSMVINDSEVRGIPSDVDLMLVFREPTAIRGYVDSAYAPKVETLNDGTRDYTMIAETDGFDIPIYRTLSTIDPVPDPAVGTFAKVQPGYSIEGLETAFFLAYVDGVFTANWKAVNHNGVWTVELIGGSEDEITPPVLPDGFSFFTGEAPPPALVLATVVR
jgi:hypothetical protein